MLYGFSLGEVNPLNKFYCHSYSKCNDSNGHLSMMAILYSALDFTSKQIFSVCHVPRKVISSQFH